jgi:ABC-type Fe3+-hydroxamate transport system substrate-binding protein
MFYLWAPGYDTDAKFTGPEAYEENLRLLGEITGRSAEADAAVKRYQTFIENLKAKAPAGAADTTVSPLLATTDGSYVTQPASSAFCVALKEDALGQCAVSPKFNASTWQVNPEAYLAMDPDWIAYTGAVDYDAATPTAKSTWKARHDPVWEKLSAVRQGHVYDAPDQMHCCGLRTLEFHLQDYAFHVWGPSSGISDPGILNAYDPAESTVLTKP